ncbi:MAG: hypothetical protein L0J49_03330, partial [Lactococcus lactis]|nr:hypothetical protein [Lactococcus lactis]
YHQILNKELKAARSKINNNIIQLDTNEKDRKDEILDELNSQRKVLISICEHLDPKNKKGLKTTFQNIFKNAD